MITRIMSLLKGISILNTIWFKLGLSLLAVGYVSYKIYSFGYTIADNRWKEKEQKEISRQMLAGEKAHQEFIKLSFELDNINSALERLYQGNLDEAFNDPDSRRIGISISGVQRLNRIKD